MGLKQLAQRPGFFPGMLSFALPGLGQALQRRWALALPGFSAFALVLALWPGSLWPLAFSLALGAEAFRWQERRGTSVEIPKGRARAYLLCGSIAFCSWTLLTTPYAGPLKRQAYANARADRLARFLRDCARRYGVFPRDFSQCPELGTPVLQDPWGREFRLEWGEGAYFLRSPGPDGTFETTDDFRYRYRVP